MRLVWLWIGIIFPVGLAGACNDAQNNATEGPIEGKADWGWGADDDQAEGISGQIVNYSSVPTTQLTVEVAWTCYNGWGGDVRSVKGEAPVNSNGTYTVPEFSTHCRSIWGTTERYIMKVYRGTDELLDSVYGIPTKIALLEFEPTTIDLRPTLAEPELYETHINLNCTRNIGNTEHSSEIGTLDGTVYRDRLDFPTGFMAMSFDGNQRAIDCDFELEITEIEDTYEVIYVDKVLLDEFREEPIMMPFPGTASW